MQTGFSLMVQYNVAKYSGSIVTEYNLTDKHFPYLQQDHIAAQR